MKFEFYMRCRTFRYSWKNWLATWSTCCPAELNVRYSMVSWAVVGLVADCEADGELLVSRVVTTTCLGEPWEHCATRKGRAMLAIQLSIPAMHLNYCWEQSKKIQVFHINKLNNKKYILKSTNILLNDILKNLLKKKNIFNC